MTGKSHDWPFGLQVWSLGFTCPMWTIPRVSIVVPFWGYLIGSLLYIWLNQKRNYNGDSRYPLSFSRMHDSMLGKAGFPGFNRCQSGSGKPSTAHRTHTEMRCKQWGFNLSSCEVSRAPGIPVMEPVSIP